MTRILRWFCIVLLLVAARPVALWAEPEDAPTALSTELLARVDAVLAGTGSASEREALYRAVVRARGDANALLATLAARRAAAPQGTAAWLEAYLLRRVGRLSDALARFTALADGEGGLRAKLEQARLLDMLGKAREAWGVWTSVLPTLDAQAAAGDRSAGTRAIDVRLRMALLGRTAGAGLSQDLTDLARASGVDAALRNRVAVVLALRGRPEEALSVYVSTGTGTERFREQIRLADWALAAGDGPAARGYAWAAQDAALLERDRRYALSVLVEAYRKTEDLPALIEKLAASETLTPAAREVWIDLLRETGRIDEALRLFRASAEGGAFTADMRRELLEMCRAAGDDAALVRTYGEMIAAEPAVTEWREGLSRHYLEAGQPEAARAVWTPYLEDPRWTKYLLTAAEGLSGLGLDELAARFAETSLERGEAPAAALLFLFGLHRRRGAFEEARAQLVRFDKLAAADAPERMQLAEAYEQLGDKQRAVAVLRALSEARGPERSAEDMEMRLAWLSSEVGDEEEALQRWLQLWRRVDSVSRRRYVEDRLMTVAARLGTLADIAIELEEKLAAGTADARDSGLLTRLYTKAGDPISATEVIEEYMRGTGAAPVAVLVEKSRVFLACNDYSGYEQTIRRLIEVDPENQADYLRQLAMSQLERGKPEEAQAVLADLARVKDASDGAEFEAGVLALAGLREDAVRAYRRGLAHAPDRIESLLLMTGLMAQTGQKNEAVGMLQHLAETAEKDDLFMIAIDGLLNLEAAPEVLRWARRSTLARLAGRHDKVYLYQLIADLAEQTGDREVLLRALQGALPIMGERRASLLRELMDHTRAAASEREQHLSFGRRLIGLGEIAPPQVYLDLGKIFLGQGDLAGARKTFALASDLPDRNAFEQEVASAFEAAGYPQEALASWQRLLLSSPSDVATLLKVGELQERVGRDDVAVGLYARALEVMIARRPLSTFVKAEEPVDRPVWSRARNVDDYDRFYERVLTGFLATMADTPAMGLWLMRARAALEADLVKVRENRDRAAAADVSAKEDAAPTALAAWPRVRDRAQVYRRVSIALGRPELADDLDLALLAALPKDEALLRTLVRDRLTWGLVASARTLLAKGGRPDEDTRKLRLLIEGGALEGLGRVSLLEANRLFLPLVVAGEEEGLRTLLGRLDLSTVSKEDGDLMPVLQSAALQLGDGRLALALGRHWLRILIKKDKRPDAPMRFRPVLQRIQGLLDPAAYRSLCEYVVQLVLEDPKQSGYWLSLLPEMQENFETPLLSEEQRRALIEGIDGTRWYWIGSLFPLLPDAQRGAVLRGALPKVPATQRLSFLLRLVDEVENPIEGSFRELLLEAFEEALGELDKAQPHVWYTFLNLSRGVTHLELRRELMDRTIARVPDQPIVRAAHAILLPRLDRRAEGVAEALAVLPQLMGSKVHYTIRSTRNALLDTYLPEDQAAFEQALSAGRTTGSPTRDETALRIEIARRARDAAVLLQAYRDAVAAHPEEAQYARQLRGQLRSLGYTQEALRLAQAAYEASPEDESLQEELIAAWLEVGNPVEALRLTLALEARRAAAAGDREVPEQVSPWVRPEEIRSAVERDALGEAAILMRRLWRRFQAGAPQGQSYFYFPNQRAPLWPADPASEEERASVARLRGGLSSYEAAAANPRAPARTLYEALSAYPFGTDEMARELRTWDGARLAGGGDLIDGLARGLAAQRGIDAAVRGLLREAQAGRAGKLTYGVLLALFADAPGELLVDARPVLLDLERTLDPTDAGQLRRLARVWARMGDPERAARIYRWCGTRASGGRTQIFSAAARPIPTSELVAEVGETLTGALRDETIEAILAFGDPGSDMRYGPFDLDAYQALVLETWTRLLGPEAALAKCRALCDKMAAGTRMPERRTALLAAVLLARGGEIEAAQNALERAVCRLEPPAGVPVHQHSWYERGSRLSRDDVRRLLPEEGAESLEAKAWAAALVDAFPRWVAEGRSESAGLFEALAVALVRLGDGGGRAQALQVLPTLQGWAGTRAYYQLWVADVARRLGDEAQADEIERTLLSEGRLNPWRVAEVLARMRTQEGAAAALAAGERAAVFLLHPVVLEELIRSATDAGDPARAAHWTQKKAEVEAAAQELDARESAK